MLNKYSPTLSRTLKSSCKLFFSSKHSKPTYFQIFKTSSHWLIDRFNFLFFLSTEKSKRNIVIRKASELNTISLYNNDYKIQNVKSFSHFFPSANRFLIFAKKKSRKESVHIFALKRMHVFDLKIASESDL